MRNETKRVDYDGKQFSIAVKYSDISRDWLVFLHGLGCSKECFDDVYTTGLAKQYSILTFDFIGFGDSDKPDDFSYKLEDQAEITKLLLKAFDPRLIVFAAHSMGGAIGVLLAKDLVNIAGLINVEGNLVPEDAGIVSRQTAEQHETTFVTEGAQKFLDGLRSSNEAAFRVWAHWYEQASRTAIYRSSKSLVEWSDSGKLLPYFNKVATKKAYIYGDQTENASLLKQLEDTDIISIPDSGHFMMLDNPEAFYSAIEKHLAD